MNQNWYKHQRFPLIPIFQYQKDIKDYTLYIEFKWLFIRIFASDIFSFSISVIADSYAGIGIEIILPYLSVDLLIPIPRFINSLNYKYLHRRRKKS